MIFDAKHQPVNLSYLGGLALIKALCSEHCPAGIKLDLIDTTLMVDQIHTFVDDHQDITPYQEDFTLELLNTLKDSYCKSGLTLGLPHFLKCRNLHLG